MDDRNKFSLVFDGTAAAGGAAEVLNITALSSLQFQRPVRVNSIYCGARILNGASPFAYRNPTQWTVTLVGIGSTPLKERVPTIAVGLAGTIITNTLEYYFFPGLTQVDLKDSPNSILPVQPINVVLAAYATFAISDVVNWRLELNGVYLDDHIL